MSTVTSNGIDVAGALSNMLYSGFSVRDCISEDIDNALDAGSTTIRIYLDDNDKMLYIVDNGSGMSETGLRSANVLHKRNDQPATTIPGQPPVRNGRFSIGGKAAKITYSQNKYPSTIISKVADGQLNELTLDWPSAIQNNFLQIAPHRITEDGRKLWTEYSIANAVSDPAVANQGTLLCCRCDDRIYDEIRQDIVSGGLVKYIGEKYHQYLLNRGIVMELFISEKEDDDDEDNGEYETLEQTHFPVLGIDILGLDVVDASHTIKHDLEVWQENGSDKLLVYFENGNGKMVFLDTYTDPAKPKQINKAYPPDGASKKAKLPIISSYDQSWVSTDENKQPLGGRFMMRGLKVIDKFDRTFPGKGDYGERKIIAFARHLVICFPTLDKDMGIQVNKSHIKESDINFHLNETVKYVTDNFAKQLYKNYYKVVKPEPEVLPTPPTPAPSVPIPRPATVSTTVPVPTNIPSPSPVSATVAITRPRLYQIDNIKFNIGSGQLVITDITNPQQIEKIAELNTYGKCEQLREWTMEHFKRLQVANSETSRSQFITFVRAFGQLIREP